MKALEAKILDSKHLELVEPIPLRPGLRVEVSIRLQESVDHEIEPELSGPRRERELEWRHRHRDLLRAYAGQWVVLEGEEIVAHGKSITPLVEEARSRGIQVPYVFFVEENRPDVVDIGL